MRPSAPSLSNFSTTVRCRGGSRDAAAPPLFIRPIAASDAAALRHGFDELSAESRYYRFHAGLPRLSDGIVRYLTQVDGIDHVALVGLEPGPHGSAADGVGVARFIRERQQPDCAELAIAVIDRAQHHGVARRLLRALAEAARDRGIRTFTMQVLASNGRVRHLLAGLGALPVAGAGEVITYHVPVNALIDGAGAPRAHGSA